MTQSDAQNCKKVSIKQSIEYFTFYMYSGS